MIDRMLLAIVSSTLSMAASAADVPSTPSVKDFKGRYVVTDVVGYLEISGGVPLARDSLGKVLTISDKDLSFSKYPCKPHSGFSVKEVETASKLDELYGEVTPLEVGLGPKAPLLDSQNCIQIFKVRDNMVLFNWNGVLLRATRDDDTNSGNPRKQKHK